MRRLLVLGLLLLSCRKDAPAVCDTGDEAWVQRAMPLIWGRKPHGAAEVRLWAEVASEHGREVVVRAMTGSDAYRDRWEELLLDAIEAARVGELADPACYAEALRPDDAGELARWLATASPTDTTAPFTMADVIRSALHADDLAVVYRVHLFARMNRAPTSANVAPRELELSRRERAGDGFLRTYLHRDLTCVPCHNSAGAVTDDPDPALDRHWPVPGLYEQGVFGASGGLDAGRLYQVFRYAGVVGGAASPFGLDAACGTLAGPDEVPADEIEADGWLAGPLGDRGSVWDAERVLARGVDALATGPGVAADGEVDGASAVAWLLAQNVVDQVWREAVGERLTVAHGFPRNEAQRDRLQGLTEVFVRERFSLRELLVAVATDPVFNAGVACGADPYGLEPIADPWTVHDDDERRHGNGPGDLVHRHEARVLVRSVHDSLMWPQPAPFLAADDAMIDLETGLGAWMRHDQPGWRGTHFQGQLVFEETYAACLPPISRGAGDGCAPTPTHAGCASCDCQSCACGLDPYCCDVQWDELCVELCVEDCGGCGGGLAADPRDAVERITDAAVAADRTLEDVVIALEDRLLAHGAVSADERPLFEALVGVPLATPAADVADLDAAARRVCGALLSSPQYQLVLDPGDAGPVPALALEAETDCAAATALLAPHDIIPVCGDAR